MCLRCECKQATMAATFGAMRKWIAFASSSAAIAVILGALGAHALKTVLPDAQLASFETAVRYHVYHALAILLTAIIGLQLKASLQVTLWLFAIGTLLFSGSIYLLATIPLHGLEELRALGPVTPIGGVLLIAGWVSLAVTSMRSREI
jgi:uncharacterized membrane protein YgdD (TMEM256/DUF423 family)